jgi:predicted anti-sigma-YlaC factor YlaD
MTTEAVMPTCDDIRTLIAIGDGDAPDVQAHLSECTACTDYATADATLNRVVAGKFLEQPSPQLTAKLFAIAADHALPAPPHARTWWASLSVAFISMVALGFSIWLSAHIVLMFNGASTYHTYAEMIIAAPDYFYTWAATLPTIGTAFVTLSAMRNQLIVMLVIGLLFLGYYNQRGVRQSKRSK